MKQNIKQILFKLFYVIWGRILPLLLVLGLFIGIFFNLWKIQNIPLVWAIIISLVGFALIGFGFGKLLKLW
jgi:hypothetical protein